MIIVSGPLPTYRQGQERFSRLFALNEWSRVDLSKGHLQDVTHQMTICRSCCTARGSERHQPEVLKFYRSLIETVRHTSPEAAIIVSGPLPTYRQGQESDACGETTRRLWAAGSVSALETSQADVHKSVEDAIISGFIQSGTDTTPWITQRKTRARTRARTSPPPPPPPVFEISTRNRFSPLRESERDDAVIIGTSMVRHVRATSGKGMVCTHCFPGAHVLDVATQVPEILNGDERVGAVVLNVGANDIRLRF
ncbi:hypothetical protein F2P79_021590 [Pimephales promelas]|nr:hypothetical protein F2P79_021590 [Pimephales promelas]